MTFGYEIKNEGSLKVQEISCNFFDSKHWETAKQEPQKITVKSSEVVQPPLLAESFIPSTQEFLSLEEKKTKCNKPQAQPTNIKQSLSEFI